MWVIHTETLEQVSDLDPNASDILDTTNDFDSHVCDTPETPETGETLETLETPVTLESVSFSDSNVSNTPETPETGETLATVNDIDLNVCDTPKTVETLEALPQTPPPIDIDSITKKIRTIFYCTHNAHYVQWRVSDTRRIGCPYCDSWLVRDTIYNPTILALYEILTQHAPHENEHRHAWLERIAPFIP